VASIHDAEGRQLVERARLWLGTLGSSVVVAINSPENVMHTPGPWIVQLDRSTKGKAPRMALVVAGGRAAIDCTGSGKDFNQDCANAKLIAAAPDLLAALVAVLEIEDRDEFVPLTELDKAWTAARAAIAKAQG
jgi:hypothetical protein